MLARYLQNHGSETSSQTNRCNVWGILYIYPVFTGYAFSQRLNSVSSFTFSFFSCFLLHCKSSTRLKNDSPCWWMFLHRVRSRRYFSQQNLKNRFKSAKENQLRILRQYIVLICLIHHPTILIHPNSSSVIHTFHWFSPPLGSRVGPEESRLFLTRDSGCIEELRVFSWNKGWWDQLLCAHKLGSFGHKPGREIRGSTWEHRCAHIVYTVDHLGSFTLWTVTFFVQAKCLTLHVPHNLYTKVELQLASWSIYGAFNAGAALAYVVAKTTRNVAAGPDSNTT